MAGVLLTDVTKSWASFTAIDGFNLEVLDGKFLVLLGASGAAGPRRRA